MSEKCSNNRDDKIIYGLVRLWNLITKADMNTPADEASLKIEAAMTAAPHK